jgi:hypothetical protein
VIGWLLDEKLGRYKSYNVKIVLEAVENLEVP